MNIRVLPQNKAAEPPNKIVAYVFMGIILLALVFFVYNWWRCRQSRVIEQEMEDHKHQYDDDDDFRQAGPPSRTHKEI